jgi:hypothetical protein
MISLIALRYPSVVLKKHFMADVPRRQLFSKAVRAGPAAPMSVARGSKFTTWSDRANQAMRSDSKERTSEEETILTSLYPTRLLHPMALASQRGKLRLYFDVLSNAFRVADCRLPLHVAPATVALNASCSPAACTSSVSPCLMFPRRNSSARGSSRYFSTARRIGRAP